MTTASSGSSCATTATTRSDVRDGVIVAAFDDESEFQACLHEVEAEIRRRREDGENDDWREHASGTIYEPGYLRRAANGHLVWRAIKRGISTPALRDLKLPSNMSSMTAERVEALMTVTGPEELDAFVICPGTTMPTEYPGPIARSITAWSAPVWTPGRSGGARVRLCW